ncbi:hypothetical protein RJ640_005432 [Escallonia rubra]|uniref:Uncharacterized protein n=1 Tax=Escallonia rubra TaxID=112253 RepID=A0AA88QBW2_9ASTE|nr:hypothetical protein RJ640_005432 [Escallonia rubra]
MATKVDWNETPMTHIYKVDLRGLKMGDVKVEVKDDKVFQISNERALKLPRFATQVIDTDERRATRFKNGLRYGIRNFLTAITLDTYGQVLDKAQRVEKDVEDGRKYYKEQRQKRGIEENNSRGNDVVQPKSKNNNLATKEPFKNTQEHIWKDGIGLIYLKHRKNDDSKSRKESAKDKERSSRKVTGYVGVLNRDAEWVLVSVLALL